MRLVHHPIKVPLMHLITTQRVCLHRCNSPDFYLLFRYIIYYLSLLTVLGQTVQVVQKWARKAATEKTKRAHTHTEENSWTREAATVTSGGAANNFKRQKWRNADPGGCQMIRTTQAELVNKRMEWTAFLLPKCAERTRNSQKGGKTSAKEFGKGSFVPDAAP